jgi:transcription elongation factor SPT6
MKWPLQFISGLGPRKADTLLQGLATAGAKIETRDQLEELMGKHVWRNAIGFIKVFVDEDEDSYGSPEILDQTRIHPDDYKLARKIAKDAFTERERERERDVDYVEKLMTNPQKLEEIGVLCWCCGVDDCFRKKSYTFIFRH